MAKLSADDLIEAFKELSLIELSDFVKKFEEVFEVTAAAPVAAPLCTEGSRRSDARTEYRGAEAGKHADHLGAADCGIPLARRQLAPEEGSDSVVLVRS